MLLTVIQVLNVIFTSTDREGVLLTVIKVLNVIFTSLLD